MEVNFTEEELKGLPDDPVCLFSTVRTSRLEQFNEYFKPVHDAEEKRQDSIIKRKEILKDS